MEHYRKSDFGHLTDREILIIVATEQAVAQGRLDLTRQVELPGAV